MSEEAPPAIVEAETAAPAPEVAEPPAPEAVPEPVSAPETATGPADEVVPVQAAPTVDVAAAAAQALALAEKFAQQASDNGNKRKFDGEDGDGQEAKRSYNEESHHGDYGGGGDITEIVECPGDKVGRVIGRMGATIKDLQERTHCRIQVEQKAIGDSKPVTITGSRENVAICKKLIHEVLTSDAPSSVPGDTSRSIPCPQGIVGRIIGRGGETIRSLQQASEAHIMVDQNFPEGADRKITISGRPEAVDRAARMVTELISGEPSGASSVIQKFGLGTTRIMDCPKTMVGRVIGKGGETIKSLQKQFAASIQIEQGGNPCKITITGPTAAVSAAERAIIDIIEDRGGPPHMGGGGGGYGGGGGGPPMGGGGGRPYQAPPPYGAPYGAPSPYPPPYGAPNPYAGPPPPAYGGYGGYSAPPAYAPPAYQQPPPAYAPYGAGGYGAPPDPYANPYGGGYGAPPAAAPAPAPAQPSPWSALQDDQNRTYYYNSVTGVSQWEKPAEMP